MKIFFLFILTILFIVFGCLQNNQANLAANSTIIQNNSDDNMVQVGNSVRVRYVGSLENGSVFDTNIKEEAIKGGLPLRSNYPPLEFKVGAGQMIKGFENGVIGMKEGDEKIIEIPPDQAYGNYRNDLVLNVNKSNIQGVNPIIGSSIQTSDGQLGVITNISNDIVSIDFNHPLAGKKLIFKIKLEKIFK